MYPLLFIPNQKNPEQEYLEDLPVTYDLKCSEEFGYGKRCVSISEKKKIGEPLYQVVINTVKVMPKETICQFELGEVTPGLVTKMWTTRTVRKLVGGISETVTRTLVNNGTHYSMVKGDSIPNINVTDNINKDTKADRKDKKRKKEKKA